MKIKINWLIFLIPVILIGKTEVIHMIDTSNINITNYSEKVISIHIEEKSYKLNSLQAVLIKCHESRTSYIFIESDTNEGYNIPCGSSLNIISPW